jgi:hypothetical protein
LTTKRWVMFSGLIDLVIGAQRFDKAPLIGQGQ